MKKEKHKPFWVIEESDKKPPKYIIKTNRLSKFLKKEGFSIFKDGGEENTGGAECYVRDKDRIIEEYEAKEVERVVKKIIEDESSWLSEVSEEDLEEMEEVWGDDRKPATAKALHNCDVIGDDFRIFRDDKDKAYLTFTDCLVVITKDKIKIQKWKNFEGDSDRRIWKHQRLTLCQSSDVKDGDKSQFIKGSKTGELDLTIINDKEWKKLESESDKKGSKGKWKSGDFLKWIHCLVTFPVKNNKDEIIDWKFDELKYSILNKMAGYLLHTFKDRGNSKAVILMDSTGADSDKEEGGSGKSLFLQAIQFPRYVAVMDGKQTKTDSQFLFSGFDFGHQIIALDDIAKDFDFEKLFSSITSPLRIERKRQDVVTIPFADAPKFYLCSNHALAPKNSTGGNSHSRRQSILEVSSYFTEKVKQGKGSLLINDMKEVFNDRLFFGNDWDNNEWNIYYNWMFRAVQSWLKDSHLPDIEEMATMGIDFSNTKSKKLKQMGIAPIEQEWFTEIILNEFPTYPNKEIAKDELWDKFKTEMDLKYATHEEAKRKQEWKDRFLIMLDEHGEELEKTKGRPSYMRNSVEYFRIKS